MQYIEKWFLFKYNIANLVDQGVLSNCFTIHQISNSFIHIAKLYCCKVFFFLPVELQLLTYVFIFRTLWHLTQKYISQVTRQTYCDKEKMTNKACSRTEELLWLSASLSLFTPSSCAGKFSSGLVAYFPTAR